MDGPGEATAQSLSDSQEFTKRYATEIVLTPGIGVRRLGCFARPIKIGLVPKWRYTRAE